MVMDLNVSSDVKTYGAPTVPVVEQEDKVKPQVAPVPKDTESEKLALNDQSLHGKSRGQEAKKITREELEEIMAEVQARLDSIGGNLTLGLYEHQEAEKIVVQVRDKASHEVVRQFPSEELLKLQTKLNDIVGLLFDESA